MIMTWWSWMILYTYVNIYIYLIWYIIIYTSYHGIIYDQKKTATPATRSSTEGFQWGSSSAWALTPAARLPCWQWHLDVAGERSSKPRSPSVLLFDTFKGDGREGDIYIIYIIYHYIVCIYIYTYIVHNVVYRESFMVDICLRDVSFIFYG